MDGKYVFISYSTKDGNVPFEICDFLEKKGIKCWIAPRNILPGNSYASEIIKGIKNCSAFLVLTSNNTNSSEHVLNELECAVNNKKTIIPFRLENIAFTDDYMYYLSRKHWINYFDNNDNALRLLLQTLSSVSSLINEEQVKVQDKVEFKEEVKNIKDDRDIKTIDPIVAECTPMFREYFNTQKEAIVNRLSNAEIVEILENITFCVPRYFSGLLDFYFCENSENLTINLKYDLRSKNYKDFKLLFKSSNKDVTSFFIDKGIFYDMVAEEKYSLDDEVDVSTINSAEVKEIFIDSFLNSFNVKDDIDDEIKTIIQKILKDKCLISCGGYNLFNNFILECTNDDDYTCRIISDDEGKILLLEIKSLDGKNTMGIRVDEEVDNFDMPTTFGYTAK